MVKRTCDKCGKTMDLPNLFTPFYSCGDPNSITKATLVITRKVTETTYVPIDLCDECEKEVYDFIFDP